MKTISLLLISVTMLACVPNPKSEIEKRTLSGTVLCDALFTQLPGKFLANDSFLIWQDPFAKDIFLHIHDIKDGTELATAGKIGKGPKEFTTPSMEFIRENNIFVYDLNGLKEGMVSIASALAGSIQSNILSHNDNEGVTRITQVDSITTIALKPDDEKLFEIRRHEERISFGKRIFKEKINNAYSVFQGDIAYHPSKQLFVYSNSAFPYLAIYKKENRSFDLGYETGSPKNPEFTEIGLKLDRKKRGIFSMTLTLNYIVCHQRDYSVNNQDESLMGRDVSKAPKTVFLYDYKGNLKEIVNLGHPIVRITSNPDSNILYAIIHNEEYKIAKYQL